MKALLAGWNFMRILRMGFGVVILVQGIINKDALAILLGVAFGGLAVANVGCCGANGCSVNYQKKVNDNEITYEELDNK